MFRRRRVAPQPSRDSAMDYKQAEAEEERAQRPAVKPRLLLNKYFLSSRESSEQRKQVNFHDIVDEDDRIKEERFTRAFVGWLIHSPGFKLFMLAVIILNSVLIGLQTIKYLEQRYQAVFLALDSVFLTIYMIEILLKFYFDFFLFWRIWWNIFDFLIVVLSLFGPTLAILSGSRVLRVLRVSRAFRSLRSISSVRGLQIVVHTVIRSIPDMANIVALLLMIMFIFAVLGRALFGDACPGHFGSLGSVMFALFICITQDGWVGIVEELQSCNNYVLGAIYLLVFITIGAFILANLVVAVVVTNLEWAIVERKRLEEEEMQRQLRHRKGSRNLEEWKPVDVTAAFSKLAKHQKPLEIPEFNLSVRSLENYFLTVAAIEDNLVEFKSTKEELSEILQEIKALARVDVMADEEVGHRKFSKAFVKNTESHAETLYNFRSSIQARRRSTIASLGKGDILSDLISRGRKRELRSDRASTIHSLLGQLHGQPSTFSAASPSPSHSPLSPPHHPPSPAHSPPPQDNTSPRGSPTSPRPPSLHLSPPSTYSTPPQSPTHTPSSSPPGTAD